tara:strand:+ start:964 stop:1140 length:177 start_codon:yes stop_codon:yes gene_type:complete
MQTNPPQAQNSQPPRRANRRLLLKQRQQGLVPLGQILPTIYLDQNELPSQIASWLVRG